MKAIICEGIGAAEILTIQNLPTPKPNADQLLIKVHATALNRADILQRKGKYPPPAGESATLGLEIAGEVVDSGNSDFKIGQRVFGLVGGGGYAEYCLLDQHLAIPIPEQWDYITAAAIPEAFITAHHTIFELGELQPQESILIHAGGSGVGTAGIQMAKHIGATVFVTAGSDEKIAKAIQLGADGGFNYKTQDFVKEIAALTQQKGIDVIQDFIGANYLNQHLQSLKPGGRLIQVALMGGKTGEIDLAPIIQKHLQLKGAILRSRSIEYKRGLTARFSSSWLPPLIAGQLKPIIAKIFTINDIQNAHRFLEANQNFGKVVITF